MILFREIFIFDIMGVVYGDSSKKAGYWYCNVMEYRAFESMDLIRFGGWWGLLLVGCFLVKVMFVVLSAGWFLGKLCLYFDRNKSRGKY